MAAPATASGAAAAAPPIALPARRIACVAGFGVSGISASVARRFGRAGFDVALLARRGDRLQQGEQQLRAAGGSASLLPPLRSASIS
jgi:NADP-dependent 3-hydroxy acid dehydrogenase YdfG